MGTDSKTAVQQPSSKIAVVSSSKSLKKKKTKTTHHKSKHSKQQRSDSSSSHSSDDNERTAASSSSKKTQKGKSTKEKSKGSSSNDPRYNSKKSSSNKKKSTRSKHDSSESPHRKNNRSTRSRSKSRSDSGRSSDRSSSRESSSRQRSKNSNRRSNSNMPSAYSSTSHSNFSSNMPRRYAQSGHLQNRGGRMMPYMPPGMMGGQGAKNNGLRRQGAGGNSPPPSLMGGYRGQGNGNFRGRGNNNAMSNQAYMHNMASMLTLLQQQHQKQQQQKPGSHKFNNPNNPNNRFYQQFQDNYKKISSGQKVSNLYQASFPVQHIPSEMRFNFRLLGRNIFTASDEEEEEKAQQEKAAAASEKRAKHHDSSSDSESNSGREGSNRRGDDDEDDVHDKKSKSKLKFATGNKGSNEQKRFSGKPNRNRTSSTTAAHSKTTPKPQDLLNDPSNLSTLLAGIIRADDPETLTNTLATAVAAVTNKRERNKQQEKEVQKFKNYARIQQIQASAAGVAPSTNPEDVEKKIHGLARRLQMKTIGLHDDYEQQGIKRSDESSGDSDTGAHHRHLAGSSSDRSKDKDGASDGSNNSQIQRKLRNSKRTSRKMNAAGQPIGSSDSEHHRSDGNDSDGSMLNLKEDLKPISYYIKDRERMLKEMFRCVRGHKLQAILPDALKTRSLEEIKSKCLDQLDILSKKRIRAILLAQPMTSSSGTEDSSDEDEQDFLSLYPHLKSSFETNNSNQNNVPETNTTGANPSSDNQKKSLPNSKFRPVQMQAVTEMAQPIYNSLSAPVVVGGDEDVNDYYEGFKHLKKLSSLRRNEQEDDFLPFPDQSGKVLQPIGSSVPKFEFKPITSLTHSQQAHLNARRAAHRQQQQQQQKDVRQEIDDLLNLEDFVIPEGERPLSSAELSTNEQRRYGLPPRLHHRPAPGPPKKGSLGDLLKQKGKSTAERSPSPIIEEARIRRAGRRRHRSRSLSSTGSGKWSRSSSRSNRDEPTSPILSRDTTPTLVDKTNGIDEETGLQNEDLTDMNDLSKLLDLNEEDELLLLQIEVEQEEKNLRRQQKRQRKEEKKNRKKMKKVNSSDEDDQTFVQQCLEDLLGRIVRANDSSKRTFDNLNSSINSDDTLKKLKTELST